MATAEPNYNPEVATGGSSLFSLAPQVLVAPQQDIVFSGLDGNTHGRYLIKGWGPMVNGGSLTVGFNGSAASVLVQNLQQNSGTSSVGVGAWATARTQLGFEMYVDASILVAGMQRGVRGHAHGFVNVANYFQYVFSAHWNDNTNNMTSITLFGAAAGVWLAGYRVTCEQVA
jgi:hypothetical protein